MNAVAGVNNSVLRASHLRKSFRSRCVVEDLSLQVESGEIVGLLFLISDTTTT